MLVKKSKLVLNICWIEITFEWIFKQCKSLRKSVRIWSYSGPYFPAFGLAFSPNAAKYGPE